MCSPGMEHAYVRHARNSEVDSWSSPVTAALDTSNTSFAPTLFPSLPAFVGSNASLLAGDTASFPSAGVATFPSLAVQRAGSGESPANATVHRPPSTYVPRSEPERRLTTGGGAGFVLRLTTGNLSASSDAFAVLRGAPARLHALDGCAAAVPPLRRARWVALVIGNLTEAAGCRWGEEGREFVSMQALPPARVVVLDSGGNVVESRGTEVGVALDVLGSGYSPAAMEGQLFGNASAVVEEGEARFGGLRVNTRRSDYVLEFGATGLASWRSAVFGVRAGRCGAGVAREGGVGWWAGEWVAVLAMMLTSEGESGART